jgi:hypothetical protein
VFNSNSFFFQLITFASSRAAHITFQEETRTVLRHVLLHNWTDTRDVFVYPPGAGPYGVYTRGGFEEALRDVFCQVSAACVRALTYIVCTVLLSQFNTVQYCRVRAYKLDRSKR